MRPIFKTLPAATVGMLLFVGALLLVSQMVRAQVAGQGGQAGGQAGQAGGQAGQAGQAGGTGVAGIYVDADGVVSLVFPRDKTGLLDAKRRAELAGQTLPTEVNRTSALRKVSLLKLEQVLQDYADRREHVPDELQFLAGLQRIDYLFVDPEGKDLIIAGPAEGFVVDSFGRGLGVQTGRPTLRLDDLVIAFRTVLRGSPVGCSIDPDETRLAQLKSFVAQNSGAATSQVAKSRLEQMPRILGLQNVRTFGVPPESHFAQVLVEADYRMKRLCLGLDTAPVKGFKSHLAMIAPGGNTMQRWWFTPYYEPFVRSEDGLAIRIAGQRVQLLAQEEFVSDTGKRSDSAFSPVSLQKYAQLFTEKYPGLAAAMPVLADLQNLFD